MDAGDNLWEAPLRREQLVELLDGRGPRPVRTEGARSLVRGSGADLLGIWYAEAESALTPLPQLLVAERKVLDDLFAWSASYLRAFGPLSSVVRTLTPNQLEALLNRSTPAQPWRLAGGAIGLIVGEILSHSEKIGVEAAITAAPSSTLAFSIMRAWYLGFQESAIIDICDGYVSLFEQLQRPSLVPAISAVEHVAMALLGLGSSGRGAGPKSRQSAKWMEELRSGASVYEIAKQALHSTADLLSSKDAQNLEQMTAEARVQFFDKVAPTFTTSLGDADRMEHAFALALAAFICRPGLEQQASLLREHAVRLPESWLWLGALQAFSPILDALSLNSGSGWRIARELFRPEEPWASPRADAGIGEVMALSRNHSKVVERLLNRPRLDVEIYPMITTAVRGLSAALDQSDDRRDVERQASPEAVASAKLELVEKRLEELLREVRHYEADGRLRSGRKRR